MVNNIRVKMFFEMLGMISLFANEMLENKITIEGLFFKVPLQ